MNLHLSALPFLVACTSVPLAPRVADEDSALRHALEGTPEGIGVLAFLADPATTVALLDHEVPLDSRAAKNLVTHRDGADGIRGTADDDAFGTLDEVDAVAYVGTAAMDALLAWAGSHDWIPTGDEVLGTWEGVTFTADEALATLDLANAATHTELDVDLGLDRRAADSIVAAQPIGSVLALSELYYVGTAALETLRDAAAPPPEPPAEEVPVADPDCATGGAWLGGTVRYDLLPDAVAAASAGDTIVLCDSGYGDPIVVERDLTLRSVGGAATTAIDVTAMGASAIQVLGDASLVLDGLTVTYGEGTTLPSGRRVGAGLYAATTGDVTLIGCVFQENYAQDGAAIWHGGLGRLVLQETTVRFNYAQADGGGIWTSGPVEITGGALDLNEAVAGGAIRVAAGGTVAASGVVLGENAPDDVRSATSFSTDGPVSFDCTDAGCGLR